MLQFSCEKKLTLKVTQQGQHKFDITAHIQITESNRLRPFGKSHGLKFSMCMCFQKPLSAIVVEGPEILSGQ